MGAIRHGERASRPCELGPWARPTVVPSCAKSMRSRIPDATRQANSLGIYGTKMFRNSRQAKPGELENWRSLFRRKRKNGRRLDKTVVEPRNYWIMGSRRATGRRTAPGSRKLGLPPRPARWWPAATPRVAVSSTAPAAGRHGGLASRSPMWATWPAPRQGPTHEFALKPPLRSASAGRVPHTVPIVLAPFCSRAGNCPFSLISAGKTGRSCSHQSQRTSVRTEKQRFSTDSAHFIQSS